MSFRINGIDKEGLPSDFYFSFGNCIMIASRSFGVYAGVQDLLTYLCPVALLAMTLSGSMEY